MPSLAISTTFIGYDDVIPYLPLLNKYGIRYIELRGYPPRLNYEDQAYLDHLKSELIKYEINVSSYHLPFHDCYLSLAEENGRQKAVATMLASSKAAAFLNARCLVVHPGGAYRNKEEKKQGEEQSRKSLSEIYLVTQSLGINLALENMLPLRVGADLNWLIETQKILEGELIGICLDTSHANIVGVEWEELILKLGSKIINVHFSDNNGQADEHLFPFWGKIRWEAILKALKRIGYQYPLTLEVHQCDTIEIMLTEAIICHSRLIDIWERV